MTHVGMSRMACIAIMRIARLASTAATAYSAASNGISDDGGENARQRMARITGGAVCTASRGRKGSWRRVYHQRKASNIDIHSWRRILRKGKNALARVTHSTSLRNEIA